MNSEKYIENIGNISYNIKYNTKFEKEVRAWQFQTIAAIKKIAVLIF